MKLAIETAADGHSRRRLEPGSIEGVGLRTAKKRIQKWFCVQARYRCRFRRPLPEWFQQNAVIVTGTARLKIDCSCAASLYWRQGNWKWTARASAGAL